MSTPFYTADQSQKMDPEITLAALRKDTEKVSARSTSIKKLYASSHISLSGMFGCDGDGERVLLPSRTKFDKNEDERLRSLVEKYGTDDWARVAVYLGGRTARQCRERWRNFLQPDLINGPWTPEEDRLLIRLYHQYGPNWGIMHRAHFPTRSNNNIKNHWAILAPQLLRVTAQFDKNTGTDSQEYTQKLPLPVIKVSNQPNVRNVAEKYSIRAILA